MRKVIESHLERDWGRSFVGLCVLLKTRRRRGVQAPARGGGSRQQRRAHLVDAPEPAPGHHPQPPLVGRARPHRDRGRAGEPDADPGVGRKTRDAVVSAVVDASALLSTSAFDLDPGETRDAVEQAVEAGLLGIDHGMNEPEG